MSTTISSTANHHYTGIQGNHSNREALDVIGRVNGVKEKRRKSSLKKKPSESMHLPKLPASCGDLTVSLLMNLLTMSSNRNCFNGSLAWCSSQSPYVPFTIALNCLSLSHSLNLSGLVGGESPIVLTERRRPVPGTWMIECDVFGMFADRLPLHLHRWRDKVYDKTCVKHGFIVLTG